MPRPKPTRYRVFANAIHHIELVVREIDEQIFAADFRPYRIVERELEIISEASRHLTEAQKARFPEIPWRRIAYIGNALRQLYDDVAPSLLWEVVVRDLTPLKGVAEKLYAEVKRPTDPWPDAESK